MNKIFSKNALLVAAAVACIAGSASADEPPPGANQRHTPGAAVIMKGVNFSSHCVRFYVNGKKYSVTGRKPREAAKEIDLGKVELNKHSYMASVFKGATCGGDARNVWFKPTEGKTNFTVY